MAIYDLAFNQCKLTEAVEKYAGNVSDGKLDLPLHDLSVLL
jgi:hypothetical protein